MAGHSYSWEGALSIVAWISLGLLASFVASKFRCRTGRGMLLEIAFGIVSAAVGGTFLADVLGSTPVIGFNACSVAFAAAGASMILGIDHALARRRSP